MNTASLLRAAAALAAFAAISFATTAVASPRFGQQAFFPNMQAQEEQNADEGFEVPGNLRRQVVEYRTSEAPGTIVIDTPNTYLYFVLGNGRAIRYGIGVGREGFTWSGVQTISKKAEWPDWTPPPEMI